MIHGTRHAYKVFACRCSSCRTWKRHEKNNTMQERLLPTCLVDPDGDFEGRSLTLLQIERTLRDGHFTEGTAWQIGPRVFVVRGQGPGQRLEPL